MIRYYNRFQNRFFILKIKLSLLQFCDFHSNNNYNRFYYILFSFNFYYNSRYCYYKFINHVTKIVINNVNFFLLLFFCNNILNVIFKIVFYKSTKLIFINKF